MTLGKRSDYGDAKYSGIEIAFPEDVDRVVQVRGHYADVKRQRLHVVILISLPVPAECLVLRNSRGRDWRGA
jgi:hypothetical protein